MTFTSPQLIEMTDNCIGRIIELCHMPEIEDELDGHKILQLKRMHDASLPLVSEQLQAVAKMIHSPDVAEAFVLSPGFSQEFESQIGKTMRSMERMTSEMKAIRNVLRDRRDEMAKAAYSQPFHDRVEGATTSIISLKNAIEEFKQYRTKDNPPVRWA